MCLSAKTVYVNVTSFCAFFFFYFQTEQVSFLVLSYVTTFWPLSLVSASHCLL